MRTSVLRLDSPSGRQTSTCERRWPERGAGVMGVLTGTLNALRQMFSGKEFPSGNARPVQRTVIGDLAEIDLERN